VGDPATPARHEPGRILTPRVAFGLMAVTVRIPTTMRPLAGGSSTVKVDGATLAEVLANLESAHPGFKERLFDDDGSLRKFVNVFVADDDVRYLDGVDTKVPDGDTVSIIPAVAGG
jgi:molybdopterin synthase sulfur carrier subunit